VTLPLIPGVRPDPEPGESQATYKTRANAILDYLDQHPDVLAVSNPMLDTMFGWERGTAQRVTVRLREAGALVFDSVAGRALLYRRPLQRDADALRGSGP
jgi:hypothetical protein